jgi:hypothetical protein
MPKSTSNSLKSQSPGRTRTPTPTPSRPSDSSVYVDSKGTKIRVLGKQSGAIIHQLDDHHVLKFGHRVKPSEAVAMKLVLKETDIPLPEWIAEDFPRDREEGYLWMTFLPGRRLDTVWGNFKNETKQRLCQDIWDIVAKIRKIHYPSEYQQFVQCTADGSATHDPLIEHLKTPPTPLLSDSQLRERIFERYLHFGGRRHEKDLPQMLPLSQHSVFTHADIAPRNIIVDENHRIAGLIDWERAGWYPHYWEYATIMSPACRCGDWQDWMDRTAPRSFTCNLQGITAARRVLF